MKNLYLKIEDMWFTNIPQKLRFLLVGGFNTLSSYLFFLFFLWTSNYTVALILSYFISVNISIFTMRYYVFRAHGNFYNHYFKAAFSYLFMLLFNYAFLLALCDYLSFDARWVQAWFTVLSSVGLYCLHKYINFRD